MRLNNDDRAFLKTLVTTAIESYNETLLDASAKKDVAAIRTAAVEISKLEALSSKLNPVERKTSTKEPVKKAA